MNGLVSLMPILSLTLNLDMEPDSLTSDTEHININIDIPRSVTSRALDWIQTEWRQSGLDTKIITEHYWLKHWFYKKNSFSEVKTFDLVLLVWSRAKTICCKSSRFWKNFNFQFYHLLSCCLFPCCVDDSGQQQLSDVCNR